MAFPANWKTQIDSFPDWQQHVDGISTDQRGAFGEDDFNKPNLSVSRFSKNVGTNLAASNYVKGLKQVLFQNQPAWARFDPGSPKAARTLANLFEPATAGYPYLSQELLFERNGERFKLSFHMLNYKGKRGPFFTKPLPRIDEYFATFAFQPQTNKP